MKHRRPISILLILAFLQLTMSCLRTKTRAPEQVSSGTKVYKVVRVLKKSGETVDFGKDSPAYLIGNEIRSSGEMHLDADGLRIEKQGDTYTVTTKSGTIYKTREATRAGEYYTIKAEAFPPIPLSEVAMVWTRENNDLGTALVVVGAIAGTLGIVALIIALTKKSCPFLYASDGTDFNLEGELYSGAIFKGIERGDFLKLHSLKAGPDGYRVKIANEADETQYTDELTLLAVDHPAEIGVYAGSDGLIHTIQSPVTALAAEDFEGKDFTACLAAVDAQMWSSNPVGKDPENPANWRSGLTLRFPRPPATDRAKLVVRIGNTYWADYAFGRSLGMLGRTMPAWYQKTGQDPDIRAKADKFLSDLGVGLKVQIQGKEGWRDAGFFYPTGPFGIQDDIIVLPLDGTPVDTLTVRLQGGTFFWMIDYAAVDYSPDRPVDVQALAPYEAVDDGGRDITASLVRADGDYFVMPKPGNFALVKFPAPPLKSGMERSFLLRSRGYYTIHPGEDGPPDVLKLLAIQQNPDLFLKFSLQEIQKQITAAAATRKTEPVKDAVREKRP
ncbi:MAG: hypothetical protein ABSG19_07265 [Candidatus Aminicenantales bacterium]